MAASNFVRSNILHANFRNTLYIRCSAITMKFGNNNVHKTNCLQHNKLRLSRSFSNTVSLKQTEKLLNVNYNSIGDDGVIKTITMMSPKTRNSLSLQMIEQLIENVNDDAGETGRCRCIVIKGEGKAFSAGHNLKEMTMKEGRDYHTKIFERCNALMNKVIACPIPIIAVVDGVAAAAGCQLVAMCDIAIATESSK